MHGLAVHPGLTRGPRQDSRRRPVRSPGAATGVSGRSVDPESLYSAVPCTEHETAASRVVAAEARLAVQQVEVPADGVDVLLDALLPKVKDDADARQEFLDLLETLGPDDPRTARYRKALSTQLF